MHKISIALDWTPNVNHIGFYVAKEMGFYTELNLDVQILTPAEDHYATTPAKKVEAGQADFALCPLESLLSYRTKSKPFDLVAVAAIYQEDLSAIVVNANAGIKSPKDLDGAHYASYKARYEDKIVEQMIKNDGGVGKMQISYPGKLGIWETLLKGKADATWIFLNWEGVQAEVEGLSMTYFKLKDYGIPYSYSPVLACGQNKLEDLRDSYGKFISATKKGFIYAKDNQAEAVKILRPFVAKTDQNIPLDECLRLSAKSHGTVDEWGTLNSDKINVFLKWLKDNGLESSGLKAEDFIYTRPL